VGSEPYSFLVYGDNRTRHDVHRRVIAEVMKHGIPDFVLQTGDMVENGNDSSQWPVFFDIEKDLLRQTAFFPALGNHERNTHYFKDIFQLASTHYSFDWGNGHFAVIDSDLENVTPAVRNEFWAEESRWLEEDLQTHQKAGYRFVMAHHPPFTAVSYRQGNNPHMTALTTMFEKYHVSAGFFGHDHNYQHYLKNGIHYVTTGGGGAPLYDVNKPPDGITQKVVSIENFVNVAVNGKTAHLQAIAIDGRVLDEFDIASSVR
jgi:3',5'-cyclic AMP phosphodiesterase CpdA